MVFLRARLVSSPVRDKGVVADAETATPRGPNTSSKRSRRFYWQRRAPSTHQPLSMLGLGKGNGMVTASRRGPASVVCRAMKRGLRRPFKLHHQGKVAIQWSRAKGVSCPTNLQVSTCRRGEPRSLLAPLTVLSRAHGSWWWTRGSLVGDWSSG
ncbi:hypothetical protein BDP81DRAFT_6661 [Colletotrichum phormii]|uniref:Uncharacterized protein n=1 Tax=Colletotrichum phormii TaxID=359342 RepID=A0AAJ0A6T4_9PEZI|nr:uncharacterized protein BDP81DRAFT_6661 [Colletotrichum phormii]KAK1655600.1 hypothetical protein BDP81DRAFT_6661 [Colletotrichum phormii]